MLMTVEEARNGLECPATARQEWCGTARCAAWRWFDKSILKKTITFLSYHELGTPFWNDPEKVQEAFDKWKPDRPKGEGWCLVDKHVDDEEDFQFEATYERESEPERRGYCGLAGKPEHE